MTKAYAALTKRNQRGFTLIELLVVIAIIAVLAALVLAALSSAQKGSRDTKRRSDLNQYRTGLAQYASDNSSAYPATPGDTFATSLAGMASYLNPLPPAPTQGDANQTHYYYFRNAGGYVLCTKFERNAKFLFVYPNSSDDTKNAICVAADAQT